MFRGINAINLDEKGRLAIPKRYREVLHQDEGQLITTIDTEASCLLLYPLKDWEEIEHKVEALPSFNPATRRVQRLLIGHASETELDNQGRILIPTLLREYAGLEKHIILVGQGRKFEIWDESLWNSQRELWLKEDYSEILPTDLQNLSL
jgi:MraZ protein